MNRFEIAILSTVLFFVFDPNTEASESRPR